MSYKIITKGTWREVFVGNVLLMSVDVEWQEIMHVDLTVRPSDLSAEQWSVIDASLKEINLGLGRKAQELLGYKFLGIRQPEILSTNFTYTFVELGSRLYVDLKKPVVRIKNFTDYSHLALESMLAQNSVDLVGIQMLINNAGAKLETPKLLSLIIENKNEAVLKWVLNNYSISDEILGFSAEQAGYENAWGVFKELVIKISKNSKWIQSVSPDEYSGKYRSLIQLSQDYKRE